MNAWDFAAAVVEWAFPAIVVITCVSLAWANKWRRDEDALFEPEERCPEVDFNADRCELRFHHRGPHKMRSNWRNNVSG